MVIRHSRSDNVMPTFNHHSRETSLRRLVRFLPITWWTMDGRYIINAERSWTWLRISICNKLAHNNRPLCMYLFGIGVHANHRGNITCSLQNQNHSFNLSSDDYQFFALRLIRSTFILHEWTQLPSRIGRYDLISICAIALSVDQNWRLFRSFSKRIIS